MVDRVLSSVGHWGSEQEEQKYQVTYHTNPGIGGNLSYIPAPIFCIAIMGALNGGSGTRLQTCYFIVQEYVQHYSSCHGNRDVTTTG